MSGNRVVGAELLDRFDEMQSCGELRIWERRSSSLIVRNGVRDGRMLREHVQKQNQDFQVGGRQRSLEKSINTITQTVEAFQVEIEVQMIV